MDTTTKPRFRTYRYRLYPTYKQTVALESQLEYQCELYNAALEERIGTWKWNRKSVSYFDQCKTLTGLKEVRPEVLGSGVVLCRGTLKKLDRAFAAFFRRVKSGETPGFPRFRSRQRYDSLQWEDTDGWRVNYAQRRLYVFGIGDIKANYYRPLSGTPKAITIKREGKRWWLSVRCAGVDTEPLPPTGKDVGIDLGVVNLITTSDGDTLMGPHFGARSASQLAAAQNKLSGMQRSSKRLAKQSQVVAARHRKIKNQRLNGAHQISRQLVNDYDLIAIEDLKIKNMVRTPKAVPDPDTPGEYLPNGAAAKAGLNKAIHDAGWGILGSLLLYKAESAGREVVFVDPHHTSQECHECGHTEAGNRPTQAVFRCLQCGHADKNAAKNVLRAGRALQAQACIARI